MDAPGWSALVAALERSDLDALHDAIIQEARQALQTCDPDALIKARPHRVEVVVSDVPRILARRHRLEKVIQPTTREAFVAAVRRIAVDRWKWQDLLEEYRSLHTIGPRLHHEIEQTVLHRARWHEDPESTAQAVQEILLEKEGAQLAYAMLHAATLSEFQNLIGEVHMRQALWKARRKTAYEHAYERLRRRVARLLNSAAYGRAGELDGRTVYARPGESRTVRSLTEEETFRAYRRAADVPTLRPGEDSKRASMIYTPGNLVKVVAIIAESLPAAFTVDDVMEVLGRALVGYFEIFLPPGGEPPRVRKADGGEDASGSESVEVRQHRDPALPVPNQVVAQAAARRFLDRLEGRQRRAVALRLYEWRWEDVADLLGVTRETIDNWRNHEIAAIRHDAFEGLSEEEKQFADRQITAELRFEGLVAACVGIIRTESYETATAATGETVFGRRLAHPLRPPGASEVEAAINKIAAIPRSTGVVARRTGEERPGLYSLEWCRRALAILADEFPAGFSIETMSHVLSQATLPERLNRISKPEAAEELPA